VRNTEIHSAVHDLERLEYLLVHFRNALLQGPPGLPPGLAEGNALYLAVISSNIELLNERLGAYPENSLQIPTERARFESLRHALARLMDVGREAVPDDGLSEEIRRYLELIGQDLRQGPP
jgi:hypothetical protein